MPIPRRLAALATILAAACASTEVPDVTPDVDPSLPGVEGTDDPARAAGGSDASTDAGRAETGATPAPKPSPKPAPADAGGGDAATIVPVDAGPPPPPKPAQGEVLLTEVMYDPFGAEPDSEWFELYNETSETKSLGGLVISDGGGRTHTIKAGTTIAPGAYVVFVRSLAATGKLPSGAVAYEYGESLPSNGGVILANGDTGALYLRNGGAVIAQAAYGGWFSQTGGSSVQLKVLDFAAGADKASWCLSYNTWATGSDKGTPGAPSDCP
jgi:hypothetical protein